MNVLEILLNKRWILKSRERELYYQVKDEIPAVKKFLTEKLGYQVIVNPYMVKLEKIPATPQSWMGIREFTEKTEYGFFCMILMFLEGKEAEEQFVLSELTEYVQGQYEEEKVDWTVYRYRRYLIKVLKYCTAMGILEMNDGDEEGFVKDESREVLYENTGVSRYFMRNFTQDIMNYTGIEDFQKAEWIDINEERGIVRRQRVYRSLLMSMGLCRSFGNEEDYNYVKNYRNMIQGDLEEWIPCELQVYRSGAYLVLGEESRLGRTLPEENTLSDIMLLCAGLIRERVDKGVYQVPKEECIRISKEEFRALLEECKSRFSCGFSKMYREMLTETFCREVYEFFLEMELIREEWEDVIILPVVGKIIGVYPEDFVKAKGL
ncbi:MAG: TIGR02678 family protein [Lachnospiraceae bacterium]|nr:TIGR02678 family protein [Lachnospiraceae bacterium]MDD7026502.1 TIGR02678 family protein [Lachnospiraceae bacterium]MDY5700931.1 TIGR02678 family protein [Lachnospiraceae bacterium]